MISSLNLFRDLHYTFWSPVTGPADIFFNMASPVIFPVKYAVFTAQYLSAAINMFAVSLLTLFKSVELALSGRTELHPSEDMYDLDDYEELTAKDYLQSAGHTLLKGVLNMGMAVLSAILALCGPVLGLVAPVTRTVKSIVDLATEGASSQAEGSPTFR
ncbi:hypothetical protein [Legionella septentrionalis]|uniref:hypothetical protein n=1 Tax=Legionella septentrionalis TaxID=2498109 RepID=UPI000F8D9F1C|nr:hypothetical protein [Legionella septentrionalis]RUR17128.1 hypothetical protein ELY10_01920 [Legionella septentrionalis]